MFANCNKLNESGENKKQFSPLLLSEYCRESPCCPAACPIFGPQYSLLRGRNIALLSRQRVIKTAAIG